MKFLLDANAENRIAAYLQRLGHDAIRVDDNFPPRTSDSEVLAFAYKEKRILITNDKGDFGELIFKDLHPHAGVILFRRLRPGDIQTKLDQLTYALEAYSDWLNYFLVITPTVIRPRKTPILKVA